jgi:hypothetical protein
MYTHLHYIVNFWNKLQVCISQLYTSERKQIKNCYMCAPYLRSNDQIIGRRENVYHILQLIMSKRGKQI